jgi:hypothetical protein
MPKHHQISQEVQLEMLADGLIGPERRAGLMVLKPPLSGSNCIFIPHYSRSSAYNFSTFHSNPHPSTAIMHFLSVAAIFLSWASAKVTAEPV